MPRFLLSTGVSVREFRIDGALLSVESQRSGLGNIGALIIKYLYYFGGSLLLLLLLLLFIFIV